MKRFIRYLYEYQNGKRTRNVGFVKVEVLDDEALLQIYGRGFPVAEDRSLEIFLFYLEDGECRGIPMGEIRDSQAAFGYHLKYSEKDVGGIERFRMINGMILKLISETGKKTFAAVWDDSNPDVEQMRVPEVKADERGEKEQEIEPRTEEAKVNEPEPVKEISEKDISEKAEEEIKEDILEKEERKTHQEKEKSAPKDMIYKITRQELAGLPRNEWKLANNHFLLHGYYNYHHLVSFEKEGKCWLGVPGIYLPGEQRAAGAFGFHQFMKPGKDELDLEEYEIEDKERFGYWCRPVGAVIRKREKEEHAAETDRRREIHEGGNQTGEEGMED